MELKLYRHIYHKNIYLARNWHLCGGNSTTEFYYATEDTMRALIDANRTNFENWMHSFLDDDLKTKLQAKITFSKHIEIDGYKGICKKEMTFPVKEFVLVKFTEEEQQQ